MRRLQWYAVVSALLLCSPLMILAQDTTTPIAEGVGKIAIIGQDYNVSVLDAATGQRTALTADATRSRRYQWPTWATDGRLAYFCCENLVGQPRVGVQVFISTDGARPGKLIYQMANEAFTYAYWSPDNCAGGATCRDLAVLLSMADRPAFKVELIRDDTAALSRTIGTGAPYYYSWSPDGRQMLWQRDNRSMTVYDAVNNEIIATLAQAPGAFPAPAWSPVDNRLLFGAFNAQTQATDLTVIDGEQTQVLNAGIRGLVAFSWSPDGRYIAYRNVLRGQGVSPITVLDAASGAVVAESRSAGIAFFWSPDSQKLAYLTFSPNADAPSASRVAQQQALVIDWAVMDIASGDDRSLARFTPTGEMIYLINYFDQFNQSHRLWSPDSRYLVYGEVLPTGRTSVTVLDTTDSDAVPFSVANGFIGVWSYN